MTVESPEEGAVNRLEQIMERWPVVYRDDIVALLAVAEAAVALEPAKRANPLDNDGWPEAARCLRALAAALAPLTEEENRE